MRRRFVFLSLIAMASVAAVAAAAERKSLLEDVAGCETAADHPICLLKITAARDGGSGAWRDPDLRRNPELLAEAGITAETVARARRSNTSELAFFGPTDRATEAVSRAVALDGAGRPPAEALLPILSLAIIGPPLPRFFAASQQGESPRLLALRLLIAEGIAGRASRPLLHAAAQELERQPQPPGDRESLGPTAKDLVAAYQASGDAAGVERVRAAISDPSLEVAALTEAGLIGEAAQQAMAMDSRKVRAAVEAGFRRLLASAAEANQASPQALITALKELAGEARASGNKATAELAEGQLKAVLAAGPPRPAPLPTIPERELRENTADRMAEARQGVIRAAIRSGRILQARPLANQLLAEPDLIYVGPSGLTWKAGPRLEHLAATATPELAGARMDKVQAMLSPKVGSDLVVPLAEAWKVLGRADKIAALEGKIRPWALAEQQGNRGYHPYSVALAKLMLVVGKPLELGELNDAEMSVLVEAAAQARQALANADRILARAKNPYEQSSLMLGCMSGAEVARAWAEFEGCYRRATSSYDSAAVRGAVQAASDGDVATGRRVLALAAERWMKEAEAHSRMRDDPESVHNDSLVSFAKAELQAAGRLPKRAQAR